MEEEAPSEEVSRLLGLLRAQAGDEQTGLQEFDLGDEANFLAAYLDDRLASEAQEAVEQRLAEDPQALDIVLSAWAARTELAPPVPLGLMRRARQLNSGAAANSNRLVAPSVAAQRAATWAGIAAALLLACFGSFELGQAGYRSNAQIETLLAQAIAIEPAGLEEDLL